MKMLCDGQRKQKRLYGSTGVKLVFHRAGICSSFIARRGSWNWEGKASGRRNLAVFRNNEMALVCIAIHVMEAILQT